MTATLFDLPPIIDTKRVYSRAFACLKCAAATTVHRQPKNDWLLVVCRACGFSWEAV